MFYLPVAFAARRHRGLISSANAPVDAFRGVASVLAGFLEVGFRFLDVRFPAWWIGIGTFGIFCEHGIGRRRVASEGPRPPEGPIRS